MASSKEEVIFKVKADLAGFKQSMEQLKKLAKDSAKKVEKAMEMDMSDEGSKAGKSFSKGVESQIKNATKAVSSELKKLADQASEMEIKFDSKGLDAIKKKLADLGGNILTASDRASTSMSNNANAPNNNNYKDSFEEITPTVYNALGTLKNQVAKIGNETGKILGESIGKEAKKSISDKLNEVTLKEIMEVPSKNFKGIKFLADTFSRIADAGSLLDLTYSELDVMKEGNVTDTDRLIAKDMVKLGSNMENKFSNARIALELLCAKSNSLKDIFKNVAELFKEDIKIKLSDKLSELPEKVTRVKNTVVGQITRLRNFLREKTDLNIDGIIEKTAQIKTTMAGIGDTVKSKVGSAINSTLSKMGSAVQSSTHSAGKGVMQLGIKIQNLESRIKRAFSSSTVPVHSFGRAITSLGAKIYNVDRIPAKVKAVVNAFRETKPIKEASDRLKWVSNSIKTASNAFKGFSGKVREVVNAAKNMLIFQRVSNWIKRTGDAASKATGKVGLLSGAFKGLLGQLSMFFGVYQIGALFIQGTKDAIRYEAAIMNLQRTLGGASNTLLDFANTNAQSFGISKKQVAEYGNIFSVLLFDANKQLAKTGETMDDVAAKTADMSKQIMESAGIISGALGYDVNTVLDNLRSGLLGSSEAVDQYGLSMKIAALEQSETFRQVANGAASWNNLTTAQQQYIIAQEIVNQTAAKYGGIVRNTASMQNAFSAQLANTKLALGNVGKAIWTACLPALTALMAWLEKAFNFVAKLMSAILGLFGIEVSFSEGGGTGGAMGGLSDGLGNVGDAAGGAGDALKDAGDAAKGAGDAAKGAAKDTEKAAKDMKRALAGFDQINVLSIKDDADSGSGGSGGSGGGSGGSGGGGGGTGGGGGAGNLNDALTDVIFTNNGALDDLNSKIAEMFGKFKEGFDSVFDYSVFDRLKDDLDRIKKALEDIFGDPKVQNAAKEATDAWLISFGKFVGACATFGFELADGILGGLAKSLEEEKGYIKEKLISIFDISKETAEYFGKLSEGLAEIFRSLGSDSAKDLWSQIFSIGIITELNLEELAGKIGRDFLGFFATAISDNAPEIRKAWENTFGFLAEVLETVKEGVRDTFKTIHKVYDEHVKPFVDKVTESFSTCVGNLVKGYNTHIKPVLDKLANKFSEVYKDHIKPLIEKLGEFFGTVIDCVSKLWETWLKPLFEWLTAEFFPAIAPALELIGKVVLDVFGLISDIIGGLLDILGGIIKFLTGVFTGDWKLAWEGVCDVVGGIVEIIVGFFHACWELIKDIFSPVVEWFGEKFSKAWDAITEVWDTVVGWFEEIWEGIKAIFDPDTWFGEVFADGGEDAEEAWKDKPSFFEGIWKGIKNAFSGVVSWFSTTFGNAWQGIKNKWSDTKQWASEKWAGIKESFSETKKWFTDTFGNAWKGAKDKFTDAKKWAGDRWNDIKDGFSEAKKWFADTFGKAWKDAKDKWSDSKTWAGEKWSGIKEKFSNTKTWFTDTFGNAWKGAKDKWNDSKTWAGEKWSGIKDKFSDTKNWFGTTFSGAFSNVKEKWSSSTSWANEKWTGIKGKFSDTKNWFGNTFKGAYDNTKNAFSNVGSAFTTIWNNIKSPFSSVKSWFSNTFSPVQSALTSPFSKAISGIKSSFETIKSNVSSAVSKIKGYFNFSWSLPRPKLPRFSVSGGKAPWGFGGQGSLPKISISWYKDGGIMTRAMLFGMSGNTLLGGGEAGPEAILPLDKLWSQLNNQFQQQNAILNRTVSANAGVSNSGPINITLKINDIEMGKAVVNSLKALSEHSGEIDLPL